jgi:zinc protease
MLMRFLLRLSCIPAILLAAPTAVVAQSATSLAGTGAAQPVDPALAVPLAPDSAVTMGRLPNGLQYYIRVNKEPERRAELRLVVKAGSLQEDEAQRGLAHFVEHMAFNGTKNFQKQEMISYLESIGMQFGGDLNAGTSYDNTAYQLTVPTDAAGALEQGLQIMDDWAQGVTLAADEIEAERGVVLSEWRSGLGVGSRVRTHSDSVLLAGSRYLDRLPIGLPERIKGAPRAELVRFYQDWYRPDLMAVVVVGDVDKAAMKALIERHFGDLTTPKKGRKRTEFTIPDNSKPLVSVITDPELTGSSVELVQKYRPRPINSVERAREDLAESIFEVVLNQRLRDIATKSSSPFLGASTDFGGYLGGLKVHTVVSVAVRDGATKKGLEAALTEVERIAQHGITTEELDREKRAARSRYSQALITRSKITSASHAAAYVNHFLTERTPASVESTVARARALLESITREEVAALAKGWKSRKNLALVAMVPEKAGVVAPKADELLAVLDEVGRTPLSAEPAKAVAASNGALMPTLPTPGAVVKESVVKEVGVTQWTLANGARVILKPTDFTPDQVLLSGYSWGGTSVLSSEQLLDASLARVLPALSGLGSFSSTDLRNAIVGKLMSAGMGIGAYNQSVSGTSTVRDLETFLQLLHLHFTGARVDEEAIRSWKQRTKTSLEGRAASPEAHFADTLTKIFTQGHPRYRFLTPARIDSIDAQRALAIYQQRFADAGDFTFVIVGAFKPDSIRPLIERYIGGLPARPGSRGWRDDGVRAPAGVVQNEFRFGREPRARTSLLFHGPFVDSENDQFALGAMASVLNSRLRERLREALGGTYSVSVHPEIRAIPERTYSVQITFDAAPERVEEMQKAVFQEIDRMRKTAPTEAEVEKVRAESARQIELSVKNNGFWLQVISAYDQTARPLAELAAYGDSLKHLTAAQVHAMSQRYLDPSRYVQVTQLPDR